MADLLDFLRKHEEAFRSRARLASLYSDFRFQRQTNPDGYLANASTWLHALGRAARAGRLPSPAAVEDVNDDRFLLHSGPDLLRALQTQEHGQPLALGAVLADAVQKKELVPRRDFLDAKQSIYSRSWVPSPWQVVRWGLQQAGIIAGNHDTSGEDKLIQGDFVIVANVEDAAKAVMEHAARLPMSHTSRLYTRELFVDTFSAAVGVPRLGQRDLLVLLVFLARDRQAISYDPATGTIKIKSPSDKQASPVTEEDASIASIRGIIATLEPQIEELTAQIAHHDARAREAVTKKQLTAAKAALRSKKLAETKLNTRAATLGQLEDVYAKIEQAADQVEMVQIMESASHTLRSLNAKTGGIDKVQDVVDNLRDEMANTEEIGQVLQGAAPDIDEEEVEDELEELEKAERAKQQNEEIKVQKQRDAVEAERVHQRLQELENLHLSQSPAHESVASPEKLTE